MAPDSSIRSMEKSFPEPVALFHVLTSPLLVTLALIVHLFCHRFNIRISARKSLLIQIKKMYMTSGTW